MPKRKKKMKIAGEKAANENKLAKQIKKTAEGLYYISETDAEILPFVGKKAGTVTSEEVLKQIEGAVDTPVEERDFIGFFARLTEMQDWFGDEEKATAEKFAELKDLLEKNLSNLKVFKIGNINLDIYIVGLNSDNILMGIKTKAVET